MFRRIVHNLENVISYNIVVVSGDLYKVIKTQNLTFSEAHGAWAKLTSYFQVIWVYSIIFNIIWIRFLRWRIVGLIHYLLFFVHLEKSSVYPIKFFLTLLGCQSRLKYLNKLLIHTIGEQNLLRPDKYNCLWHLIQNSMELVLLTLYLQSVLKNVEDVKFHKIKL